MNNIIYKTNSSAYTLLLVKCYNIYICISVARILFFCTMHINVLILKILGCSNDVFSTINFACCHSLQAFLQYQILDFCHAKLNINLNDVDLSTFLVFPSFNFLFLKHAQLDLYSQNCQCGKSVQMTLTFDIEVQHILAVRKVFIRTST